MIIRTMFYKLLAQFRVFAVDTNLSCLVRLAFVSFALITTVGAYVNICARCPHVIVSETRGENIISIIIIDYYLSLSPRTE